MASEPLTEEHSVFRWTTSSAERTAPRPPPGSLPGRGRASGTMRAGAVRTEVAELLHTLREPGPFLALSNGDACPYNSRITSHGVRFFDFELAGFRHCLLDGAFLRLSFPSCYRGPPATDVRAAAEGADWDALAPVDEDAYRRGMAAACGGALAAWFERRTPTAQRAPDYPAFASLGSPG